MYLFTFYFKGHTCGEKHGLQSKAYNWSVVLQPGQKRCSLSLTKRSVFTRFAKIKCSEPADKQSREEVTRDSCVSLPFQLLIFWVSVLHNQSRGCEPSTVKGRDRGANTRLYL